MGHYFSFAFVHVQTTYPNDPASGFVRDVDQWRAFLGRFGVSGKMQTSPISQLSDGQKSRIVFATMCLRKPNMLLLDEVSIIACENGVNIGVGCLLPALVGSCRTRLGSFQCLETLHQRGRAFRAGNLSSSLWTSHILFCTPAAHQPS